MRSVSEANRQKQEKKQRNLAQAGRQVRIAGAFLLLIMLLLLSLIWSVCSGSVSVPIMEFLQELREPKLRGMAWTIIWEIRLPRALAALILGGALALSGYLLQTFFHNPIAGPFVLGISSGSKLLVALVMVGFLEWNITINSGMLVAAAFAGALLSMLFVLLVARKMEQMAMLIVGCVTKSFSAAIAIEWHLATSEKYFNCSIRIPRTSIDLCKKRIGHPSASKSRQEDSLFILKHLYSKSKA